MTDPTQSTVIVHFDKDGELDYHVTGEEVRLFIVDDRVPHDRVYEWTRRCDASDIGAIIGDDASIGHSGDERHAAVTHSILALQEGRPRLAVVPKETEPSL